MRCGSIGRMLSTAALRAHLLAARLAGPVATSREESLRSYRLFAARDPRVLLGLDPEWRWGEGDLLRLMADKCGVSADPSHVSGPDVIDPERTVAALEAFAQRLREAVLARSPLLFGTGHPHRLLGFYVSLAQALSAAGCVVLTPAQGVGVDMATRFGVRPHRIDYVRGRTGARTRRAGAGECDRRAHPFAAAGSDRARGAGGGRRTAAGAGGRRSRMGLRCRSARCGRHRAGGHG